MSRPRARRRGVLFALPAIEDSMPDALKDALALRNACEATCAALTDEQGRRL